MPDPRLPWWRRIALSLLLLWLTREFLEILEEHYAVDDWLFWHYLRAWTWSIALVVGSVGVGDVVVRRLVGRMRGLHAHVFVSFCTGLLAFGLVTFVAGMLQLYSTRLFYGLPMLMLALGAWPLYRLRHDVWPRVQRHAPLRIKGLWAIVVFVFGMYAFLMIYAGVLVPGNISFDARWMHVAMAEANAGAGGIFRYPEGYMVAARPQFATYLYTWGFLLPDSELFDRILLCAHIEFVVFAMTTLFGIPAMVRRLVPNANPTIVWVARFLFPGVFLYDSNLSVGADHIAAAWVIPIFLVTHDFVRRGMGVRWGVMVALMTGAVALSKETAAMMTIPMAALVIVVGVPWAILRARKKSGRFFQRHRWMLGLSAILMAGLTVTSPLWLKNLVWYGDPFYPTTHAYFSPRPWAPDADYMFEWGYMDYQFHYLEKDEEATDEDEEEDEKKSKDPLEMQYLWSFQPHDWPKNHGDRPVVGSLMTLLLPCVLLLRRTKRLWIAAAWVQVGLAIWFKLLPQDRYLQVLMPFMAAFVAAVLVRLWRGRVRVLTALLVGTQIVWGGDVYFLYRNQLPALVSLFEAGRHEDKLETRLATQGDYEKIGKAMPKGSRMLMHEVHPHVGVQVPSHHDFQTWQFGLSYGLMKSPREVWETFRRMKITHVFWREHKSRGWDSVAGEIMFFDFAMRYTMNRRPFGGSWVAQMPDNPPPDEASFEDTVLVAGCSGKGFASGLYRVRDLHVSPFGPDAQTFPAPRLAAKTREETLALASSASYAVLDSGCFRGADKQLPPGFRFAVDRPRVPKVKNRPYRIYIRLEGKPEPWPTEYASARAD